MPTKTRKRMMRGRSKDGSKHACVDCPALCCHDLAIPIERPRLKDDIVDLEWQLRYDTVHVAIRHRQWYMVVNARCIYLDKHNLCKVYNDRPATCREHNPPDCEKYSRWYQYWTETPDELVSYLTGKRRGLSQPSRHCSRGRLLKQKRPK